MAKRKLLPGEPQLPAEQPDLTEREKLFCLEYLKDHNAYQAAIRAGYAKNSAQSNAHRLMENEGIKQEIRARLDEQYARIKMDADKVIIEIAKLATVSPADAYNPDGSLKPIHEWPTALQMAVQAIETDELWGPKEDGPGKQQIGWTKRVKFYSRLEALRDLGKHFKLFTEVVEHRGIEGLAAELAAATKRIEQAGRCPQTPSPKPSKAGAQTK